MPSHTELITVSGEEPRSVSDDASTKQDQEEQSLQFMQADYLVRKLLFKR